MLKDKNLKIIVPARKGSKRLPNKHFREINGLPLYRYTFDYLLKNVLKDNIWLNTDDENLEEYYKVVKPWKCTNKQKEFMMIYKL